jgi:hypothetical protein
MVAARACDGGGACACDGGACVCGGVSYVCGGDACVWWRRVCQFLTEELAAFLMAAVRADEARWAPVLAAHASSKGALDEASSDALARFDEHVPRARTRLQLPSWLLLLLLLGCGGVVGFRSVVAGASRALNRLRKMELWKEKQHGDAAAEPRHPTSSHPTSSHPTSSHCISSRARTPQLGSTQ